MGHPRRLRKKYSTPKHPWQKDRIIQENKLVKEFGLKNKREIWIAKALLSKYLRIAKTLIGLSKEERLEKEKVLLNKLEKYGLIKKNAKLDDVLSITVRDVLSRRLQTIVWKKGLASTPRQARQFITHGHIALNGQKVTSPGRLITIDEEKMIDWRKSPIVVTQKQLSAEGLEKKEENVEAKGE